MTHLAAESKTANRLKMIRQALKDKAPKTYKQLQAYNKGNRKIMVQSPKPESQAPYATPKKVARSGRRKLDRNVPETSPSKDEPLPAPKM